MPTNTWMWTFVFEESAQGSLRGPEGLIALERRWMPVSSGLDDRLALASVWIPEVELQPFSRYRFEVDGAEPVEFETGAGAHVEPPPVPQLLAVDSHAGGGGRAMNRGVDMALEHAGILVVEIGSFFEDVGSAQDLLLASGASDETSATLRIVTTHDSVFVGRNDGNNCSAWPTGTADRLPVRFAALDGAGNFSGWTAPTSLEIPSLEESVRLADEAAARREAEEEEARLARALAADQPESCASTPARGGRRGSLSGFAMLLGALIVAVRRRVVR